MPPTTVATIHAFHSGIPLLEQGGISRQDSAEGVEYKWKANSCHPCGIEPKLPCTAGCGVAEDGRISQLPWRDPTMIGDSVCLAERRSSCLLDRQLALCSPPLCSSALRIAQLPRSPTQCPGFSQGLSVGRSERTSPVPVGKMGDGQDGCQAILDVSWWKPERPKSKNRRLENPNESHRPAT